jgi:hypothetical protein
MELTFTKIEGYRDLSQEEIDLITEARGLAEEVGNFIENRLRLSEYTHNKESERWIADGKLSLQKGFMSLIRSVAKPTTF